MDFETFVSYAVKGFGCFLLIIFVNMVVFSIYREIVVSLSKSKRKSKNKLPDRPFLKKNQKKLIQSLKL